MEEFIRLFLTGHALQNMLARMCDQCTGQGWAGSYTICKCISSMCKSVLCIRLTPLGLAPFRSSPSLVYLYKWMTEAQKNYIQGILSDVHVTSSMHQLREYRVQGIGQGGEVLVVTWIDGEKVWNSSSHQHLSSQIQQNQQSLSSQHQQHASQPHPSRSSSASSQLQMRQVRLRGVDVLLAMVACVFRDSTFDAPYDRHARRGVCNIILQMATHELALTRDALKRVHDLIEQLAAGGEAGGQR
jgi:hypothetical protein